MKQLSLATGTKNKWFKTLLNDVLRDRYLYLLLIPALAHLLIFRYSPMFGLKIAFLDYNAFKGVGGSEWVGLEHFITFFQGPYVWRLIRNTLIINIYSLVFSFPAPLIIALAFNELKPSSKIRKVGLGISYMPHFISSVIIVGIAISVLSPSTGVLNNIRSLMGLDRIYYLNDAKYFRTIYTTMNIWKSAGFGSIIYIAALAGVDQHLYEAVDIDGGGRWAKLFHVSIPSIAPTIIIMFIMRMGNMFETGYESIMLLYSPNTYETADVIQTFVYRNGIQNFQYSFASAVGLFQSLVGLVLVYLANLISRRVSEVSLW